MQEALAVEGDEENDASENLMILDHKNVPISVYDPVRKVMVRKGGSVSPWRACLCAVLARACVCVCMRVCLPVRCASARARRKPEGREQESEQVSAHEHEKESEQRSEENEQQQNDQRATRATKPANFELTPLKSNHFAPCMSKSQSLIESIPLNASRYSLHAEPQTQHRSGLCQRTPRLPRASRPSGL